MKCMCWRRGKGAMYVRWERGAGKVTKKERKKGGKLREGGGGGELEKICVNVKNYMTKLYKLNTLFTNFYFVLFIFYL